MAATTSPSQSRQQDYDVFSKGITEKHEFAAVDLLEQRKWRKIIVIIGALLLIGLVILIIVSATTPITLPVNSPIKFPTTPAKLGVFQKAAAAVDETICSQVASDVMQHQGGSAVDAAIAAAVCTSTFNMYATGVGGGFFMTIWDHAEQKPYVLDAREVAPLGAWEDMFEGQMFTTTNPLAIAVPGEVAGYWAAHQRFGRAPWRELFQPTIKICRNGFKVKIAQKDAMDDILSNIAVACDPKPFANLVQFLINKDTGKFYEEGDTMYCPKLAATLERIAENGAYDFYNGSLANDILSDMQEAGSILVKEDLINYKPEWREPIDMMVARRYRMVSVPPPGSGVLLGLILNIMTGYNLTAASSQDTLTYHRMVEAFKFTYGQRMMFGDESFVPEVKALARNLSTMEWANHFRSKIDDTKVQPTENYLPAFYEEDDSHGTSHISIVDTEGNAVSMTATINSRFGSGVMGSRTGIVFNDQMDDFSKGNRSDNYDLPPNPYNKIVPGKRPQSSMCPAIFLIPDEDGESNKLALVIGASGGSRITSSTAYAATRLFWFDENPKQAVDALRPHHQLLPETLFYEPDMPEVILKALYQKGDVNQTVDYISQVQAIQIAADGTRLSYSDYRKNDAVSAGF